MLKLTLKLTLQLSLSLELPLALKLTLRLTLKLRLMLNLALLLALQVTAVLPLEVEFLKASVHPGILKHVVVERRTRLKLMGRF